MVCRFGGDAHAPTLTKEKLVFSCLQRVMAMAAGLGPHPDKAAISSIKIVPTCYKSHKISFNNNNNNVQDAQEGMEEGQSFGLWTQWQPLGCGGTALFTF